MSEENKPETPDESQRPSISQRLYLLPQMHISTTNPLEILKALREGRDPEFKIYTLVDMSIFWLPIAIEHYRAAYTAHAKLQEAVESRSDEWLNTVVLAEFSASLQVITSTAFAFEAFQSIVRKKVNFPQSIIDIWDEKDTGWAGQTKEVFKYAFAIQHEHKSFIEKMIENVADFRNDAVHTKAQPEPPYYHHDLGSFTEWRLVKYSFRNARTCIEDALNIFVYLSKKPRQKYIPLVEYCEDFAKAMEPIIAEWKDWQAKNKES